MGFPPTHVGPDIVAKTAEVRRILRLGPPAAPRDATLAEVVARVAPSRLTAIEGLLDEGLDALVVEDEGAA